MAIGQSVAVRELLPLQGRSIARSRPWTKARRPPVLAGCAQTPVGSGTAGEQLKTMQILTADPAWSGVTTHSLGRIRAATGTEKDATVGAFTTLRAVKPRAIGID